MRPFSLFVHAGTAHSLRASSALSPISTRCTLYLANLRHTHSDSHDAVARYAPHKEASFERLGLKPAVLDALRLAFPSVKQPTSIQQQFIEAVLSGHDVLLKDKTGTGKSFAAVLALLSRKRAKGGQKHVRGSPTPAITSLVLVPHRDLAFQLLHWIQRIHQHMSPQDPLPSVAQVFVRDSSRSLAELLEPIQQTPPRILISTPQALLDVVQANPKALPLDGLSTVLVDEVDYLIGSVPNLKDEFARKKIERKVNRHPGPTRLLLDRIYSRPAPTPVDSRPHGRQLENARPQLVMMSATLRNHLRRFLLADSGWFDNSSGKLVRITGEVSPHNPQKEQGTQPEESAERTIGGTNVQHHVLVVSEDGDITNIAGAVDASVAGSATGESAPETSSHQGAVLPPSSESSQAPDVDQDIDTPSPFNPNAMEAIAAAFALDVPSVGLLVLPSNASVQRAVYDLRLLGVNAHGLDVVKDANGRVHLMRQDLHVAAENPTLLVSTLASTRGLDLPELTHVFILGLLDNGVVDSYLHVAGRVGRFGRGGRVVSVVADRHKVLRGDGKQTVRDEPRMMGVLLRKVGITLTRFEHFD
ncbi:P-loop containing nucleoside triphosphate hydrolase protein [Lenzites betulinus]|nr:P-loop containing nucleoside triphosphate hydrolase protein [Lenzites betulinus]